MSLSFITLKKYIFFKTNCDSYIWEEWNQCNNRWNIFVKFGFFMHRQSIHRPYSLQTIFAHGLFENLISHAQIWIFIFLIIRSSNVAFTLCFLLILYVEYTNMPYYIYDISRNNIAMLATLIKFIICMYISEQYALNTLLHWIKY